jgi:hypothetical protein
VLEYFFVIDSYLSTTLFELNIGDSLFAVFEHFWELYIRFLFCLFVILR